MTRLKRVSTLKGIQRATSMKVLDKETEKAQQGFHKRKGSIILERNLQDVSRSKIDHVLNYGRNLYCWIKPTCCSLWLHTQFVKQLEEEITWKTDALPFQGNDQTN